MKKESGNYILDSVAWILTYLQTEETFKIVCLILTAISTALSIIYTIWKWWLKAKKDGKITVKELEELDKELKGKEEKLNNVIEKGENKK